MGSGYRNRTSRICPSVHTFCPFLALMWHCSSSNQLNIKTILVFDHLGVTFWRTRPRTAPASNWNRPGLLALRSFLKARKSEKNFKIMKKPGFDLPRWSLVNLILVYYIWSWWLSISAWIFILTLSNHQNGLLDKTYIVRLVYANFRIADFPSILVYIWSYHFRVTKLTILKLTFSPRTASSNTLNSGKNSNSSMWSI